MTAYALRRVVWTIPVLLLVVTLLFFMLRAIGGDPLRRGPLVGMSGSGGWIKTGDPKPQAIEDNMRRRLRLDLPWYEQYGNYLYAVGTFDFGPTQTFRARSVNSIIERQGPVSLELGLLALAWALALGLPLGVVSALRAGTVADGGARVLTSLAFALPAFLVGALLIHLFAVRFGVLPTSGWDGPRSKLLPSFVLGLVPAAYVSRLLRAGMLETLGQEYVRTALAKGLSRSRVLVVHVVRNSLVPLVTALGPLAGYLVTGSFVVEQVFAIPGIGRYYVAGVLARDYPLVLGLTVVLTLAIVLANLLVDLLHAALDPRVRERPSFG